MEAMWTRCLPHIAENRRLLAAGALGDIVTVMADLGQDFPKDPASRLFARELGGGVLLDCGIYPVSFASMVLGKPAQILSLVTPAFTGVDGQTSMLFGFDSGAQAVLTCTSSAKTPTRAAIVGTKARIEIDSRFYAPSSFTRHRSRRERHLLSSQSTRGTACTTKPTKSLAVLAPDCWRARSCRSTRPSRSWRPWTPSSPGPTSSPLRAEPGARGAVDGNEMHKTILIPLHPRRYLRTCKNCGYEWQVSRRLCSQLRYQAGR